MGSMSISVPDIPDIDTMVVDNDVRRLAQSALVAAIDSSYAMGFIEALARTIVRPASGIKSIAKSLGVNLSSIGGSTPYSDILKTPRFTNRYESRSR
jgi:hypothetical protein